MGDTIQITVMYSTTPEGLSLSWMTAEQTDSKVLPYLFTQCEDNHCRALAPLQDTPSIKTTYTANLILDKAFVPKMTGNFTGNATLNTTHNIFSFENTIPIPSYLLAMAVGNLAEASVGTRTSVITETTMLQKCVDELSELEKSLDLAEEYLTPYIWGTYAVLILPPSFPLGGMENPLLTFASPTIIVGDKS
jgi:leukotriene-A4 hydrolase